MRVPAGANGWSKPRQNAAPNSGLGPNGTKLATLGNWVSSTVRPPAVTVSKVASRAGETLTGCRVSKITGEAPSPSCRPAQGLPGSAPRLTPQPAPAPERSPGGGERRGEAPAECDRSGKGPFRLPTPEAR